MTVRETKAVEAPSDGQSAAKETPVADMVGGAFLESLKRNNKRIRHDRAEAIHEEAQIKFRRALEDIEIGIKHMKRERENMLDLSPESAVSLVLASDFDSAGYVAKEITLGVKIRNEEIKFDLMHLRYTYLFGDA